MPPESTHIIDLVQSYPNFLDINIYLCRTQSNVSRKKLKLCKNTQINGTSVSIVIPSITSIPSSIPKKKKKWSGHVEMAHLKIAS